MKGLSTIQYKEQFNTLKGLETCNCILLISKFPFVLSMFQK